MNHCKTCEHFKKDGLIGYKYFCDSSHEPVHLANVKPDFGCVHHEEKVWRYGDIPAGGLFLWNSGLRVKTDDGQFRIVDHASGGLLDDDTTVRRPA